MTYIQSPVVAFLAQGKGGVLEGLFRAGQAFRGTGFGADKVIAAFVQNDA